MESDSLLPPKLIAIREAMGPVARTLRSRRQTAPPQSGYVRDMVGLVSDHAGRLAGWTGDFADEVNNQLALAATDAQVYRAAARVEARIECLLDDWDDVRSMKPDPADQRGWKLLVGIYGDLAEQVQGWLDEMLEILEDPAAAVERRGLADEETATITVSLTILPPPQTTALSRWVRERARATRRATGGLSLLAALLAGIGLGWLFGGDDE